MSIFLAAIAMIVCGTLAVYFVTNTVLNIKMYKMSKQKFDTEVKALEKDKEDPITLGYSEEEVRTLDTLSQKAYQELNRLMIKPILDKDKVDLFVVNEKGIDTFVSTYRRDEFAIDKVDEMANKMFDDIKIALKEKK